MAPDDRDRHAQTRRGGWLSIPSLDELSVPVEPAYSVLDRLAHIHEAPLKNLRRSFWWVRKTFFTRPRSETPAFLVELDKPAVESIFGRHHFEPGWELSYNYHGEMLNLRRVVYSDQERYEWWQVHIRGYKHPDGGLELTAHYETEPAEHPDAHIDLYGLDVAHGMEVVEGLLQEHDVEYESLDPEERVGVGTP